jgi:ribosomal-protein-alanine N-acetyltransferase
MNLGQIPLSPALAEVAQAIHAASGLNETWDENAFGQLLTLHGVAGLIAMADETPAGVILWRIVADEAEILTIAVSPTHRRLGIGRLLLDAAFSAMHENRVATVFLEVAVDNTPALGLYRGLGFSERGRRVGYYRTSAGSTDALSLGRDFPKKM